MFKLHVVKLTITTLEHVMSDFLFQLKYYQEVELVCTQNSLCHYPKLLTGFQSAINLAMPKDSQLVSVW